VSRKSVIAGLLIVLAIGIAIGYFMQNGAFSNPSNPFSGYTKLTLTLSQGKSVQFGDNSYAFTYIGQSSNFNEQGKLKFGMIAGIATTKIYDAIEGAKYNELGVELLVGEVHTDYMILYVKSTVP
jgi:hypothetical protein